VRISGADGFSPVVTLEETESGVRLTVTDAEGTRSAEVLHGTQGEKGEKGDKGDKGETGAAGASPAVAVSDIEGGHRVTITDAEGAKTFDVMDGSDADVNFVNGAAYGSLHGKRAFKEDDSYSLGMGAVAIGYDTKARGADSVAEGHTSETTEKGTHSHVEGMGTISNAPAQHIQGCYNKANGGQYAHVVGNGTLDARADIHTLKWSGKTWFKGDVYVGGDDDSNGEKLIKKSELDAAIAEVEKMEGPAGPQGPQGEKGDTGAQGPAGADGAQGADGADGISPTVAVNEITGGHCITVTDADGVKSFNVLDGADGARGPKGDKGDTGAQGEQGIQGDTGATGPKGEKGDKGDTGAAGADGFSPTVAVEDITGGHRVTITDADGAKSFDVMDGADGTGAGGSSLPAGGSPNQMLVTDSEGNTVWEDRTHWKEDVSFEVLPETQFTADDLQDGMYPSATDMLVPLEDGKTYTVTFNGVEYDCATMCINSVIYMGNLAALDASLPASDAPFVIMYALPEVAAQAGMCWGLMPLDGLTSGSVSIYYSGITYHKIPSEYLPEGVSIPTVDLTKLGVGELIGSTPAEDFSTQRWDCPSQDTVNAVIPALESGIVKFSFTMDYDGSGPFGGISSLNGFSRTIVATLNHKTNSGMDGMRYLYTGFVEGSLLYVEIDTRLLRVETKIRDLFATT